MDWQTVAIALAAVVVALAGILWGRVSGDLARVAERLSEVAQMVHGHEIRLGIMEGRDHGAR